MKKLLLLFLLAPVIWGCSDDDNMPTTQGIWLSGYTAFLPTSTYEKGDIRFLFFKANNGEQFNVSSKTFNGTISEYQYLKDETFSLLENGKISLKNGETVSADKTILASSLSETYEQLILPIGRYYVCAIYQGRKDGYNWLYSTKYTGKYYEVKPQVNQPTITVVFPCDRERYGFTEWVEVNNKFSYDFKY